MIIQQLNRTDAEKVWGAFTNGAGATITKGYGVHMAMLPASIDGNLATLSDAANQRTFMGVADDDVADNAVGLYQCYGYAASVFFFADATSVSLVAGHAAGPGVASSLGVAGKGVSFAIGPVVILESVGAVIRSAGGYVQGFVRAM